MEETSLDEVSKGIKDAEENNTLREKMSVLEAENENLRGKLAVEENNRKRNKRRRKGKRKIKEEKIKKLGKNLYRNKEE